jgi:hypothetical protein
VVDHDVEGAGAVGQDHLDTEQVPIAWEGVVVGGAFEKEMVGSGIESVAGRTDYGERAAYGQGEVLAQPVIIVDDQGPVTSGEDKLQDVAIADFLEADDVGVEMANDLSQSVEPLALRSYIVDVHVAALCVLVG